MTNQQKSKYGICPIMSGPVVVQPPSGVNSIVLEGRQVVDGPGAMPAVIGCAGPDCQLWRGTVDGGGDKAGHGEIKHGCTLRSSALVDILIDLNTAVKGLSAPQAAAVHTRDRG